MAAKSLYSFMRSQGISLFIHCDIIHQLGCDLSLCTCYLQLPDRYIKDKGTYLAF